jgi:hypothetical protein
MASKGAQTCCCYAVSNYWLCTIIEVPEVPDVLTSAQILQQWNVATLRARI